MRMEGVITLDHLKLMETAGYEFEWKIIDQAQLNQYQAQGLDVPDSIDFNRDCFVRLYIDVDLEYYFPVKEMIKMTAREKLPLLLGLGDKDFAGLVAQAIKEGSHGI